MQSISVICFVTKASYTTHHCDLCALVGWPSLHIRPVPIWDRCQECLSELRGHVRSHQAISNIVTTLIDHQRGFLEGVQLFFLSDCRICQSFFRIALIFSEPLVYLVQKMVALFFFLG